MKKLGIGNLLISVLFLPYWGFAADTPTANRITLTLDSDANVVVKGFIAPIAYTGSNFHVEWDALANLRVAEPEKQYPTAVFQAFLPTEVGLRKGSGKTFLQRLQSLLRENPTSRGNGVSVGDLWEIEQDGLLALLRQLHPNPHLDMHINSGDSRGAWACLRAYNAEIAHIVFRVHAEFRLADGWFTPSQFTRHLVLNRPDEKVAFFQMYVPHGTLNFDVNRYHNDRSIFTTDAGFCPQIELRAGTETIIQDTQFSEAIPLSEAERILIRRFYKSQYINWVSVDAALEMARAEQKPIHIVSTNGPLTDEACGGSGKSLRAVALSDDKNIELLNDSFINTWVLNTDMKRLRDANTIDDLPPLTQIIVQGWKRLSPIDSLIISPELELMGRQPVNELPLRNKAKAYRLFLSEALAGKRPGVGESIPMPLSSSRGVVLDRIQPSVEVLDTFGYATAPQDATVIRIDTTAFENGGTLTIAIQVGRADLVGSFDLFPGDSALQTEGTPQNALAQAWGIQPRETGTITYRFDKGQVFQLRATGGWVNQEGGTNAFRARISVR